MSGAEKNQPQTIPYRMLKKNGKEIWAEMRASHASSMGRPAKVRNFIDITNELKVFEQIRFFSRQLIEGIEEERRSLLSDIHDEFGQFLTSLQFDSESLSASIPQELAEAADNCAKLTAQIQLLVDKVRDTTPRLRPDLLDHFGLVFTIKWYIAELVGRRPEIDIHFQVVGLKRRLPAEAELVSYRVFQEVLNSITKYAKARNAYGPLT